MKCTTCGTINPNEATFCAQCGAQLNPLQPAAVTPSSAQVKIASSFENRTQFYTPSVPSPLMQEQAYTLHRAHEEMFAAEQDLASLKKTRQNCITAGKILGGLFLVTSALEGIGIMSGAVSGVSTSSDPILTVIAAILAAVITVGVGAAWAFFIPFGFAFLKNVFCRGSYLIIFNWILIATALILALFTACIVGPFYLLHLNSKIKQATQTIDACKQQVSKIYA